MSAKTILVDSNILVYAINNSSPKHGAAQSFLQDNIGDMAIAHQNIFESLRVLTHPKFQNPMTSTDAIAAINAISDHCHIIAPDYETHEIALALIKKHGFTGNKIFDAYLTATALSKGITSIATDNTQDFLPFKEVSLINPLSRAWFTDTRLDHNSSLFTCLLYYLPHGDQFMPGLVPFRPTRRYQLL